MNNHRVYITRIAKFLPNEPVENDDIETYLGLINGKRSLSRAFILGKNGIQKRYYALNREGKATHTNVELAENAVRQLFDKDFRVQDMELLSAGTASPEQVMPSHGVMVHGKLPDSRNVEVASFAGSCCTGIQAMKYAYLSVLSGEKSNAVCVASERLSPWMQASYFDGEAENLAQVKKRPILAFEKEFLRWMLSDGAAAVLLQNQPAAHGLSLEISWVELCSFAHIREACMYAGAEKDESGELHGWTSFPESEWLTRSIFSLKQDARLLGDNITLLGGQFYVEVLKKHRLNVEDIDWFLPHLSSMFFKDKIKEEMAQLGYPIPEEKWFVNLPDVGNVASASCFLMLEELFHSGRLLRGQKVLLMVPESARFSYGFCLLTAC